MSIVTDFKARHKEDRKKGFVSQINLWHNSHLFWHNSTSFLAQLTSFLAQLPYIVQWLTMIHNTCARRSGVKGVRCRRSEERRVGKEGRCRGSWSGAGEK